MESELVQTLKKDVEEMHALLREHGLLHELSNPALYRALNGERLVPLLVTYMLDEATKDDSDLSPYIYVVSSGLTEVRALALDPETREQAMSDLISLALGFNMVTSARVSHGDERSYSTGTLDGHIYPELCNIAHAHFMQTLLASNDWDPTTILCQIRAARYKLGINNSMYVHEFFAMGKWYLHQWQSQRIARLLLDRVAGHKLPPELIEMVQEYICERTDLRIAPDDEDSYEWYGGGQMSLSPVRKCVNPAGLEATNDSSDEA
ncbi:hypothetical protein LTR08_008907 [Meristemomyces frigidus]|nr:hypothetical protein LTR08_008907 [Meristemomyces frigidus]